MSTLGSVTELWRYPVKSLGGQRLDEAECDERGVLGDRRWAVQGADGKLGSGKTTQRCRRMPDLLSMTSRLDPSGEAEIRFPDGGTAKATDPKTAERVAAIVGETVTISEESEISHFDDAPLHLVTVQSIEWLARLLPTDSVERRRFRPNVLIDAMADGRPEDAWAGRRLRIGEVLLAVERPTVRCVMTTLRQDGIGFAPRILRELESRADACFGVYARVERAGRLAVGDTVTLVG